MKNIIVNYHFAVKNRTTDGAIIEKLLVQPSAESCRAYFAKFFPDAKVLGVRECDSSDINTFFRGIKVLQPAQK